MPKTPPCSEEFRAEAVRLLKSSGRPIPQLARELGCSEQSLRNWSRQVDAGSSASAVRAFTRGAGASPAPERLRTSG